MENKKKPRCIVTFARSWGALAATRCLGRQGVEVITGDTSSIAASNFSFYSNDFFTYPDPSTDPEGYLDTLEQACLEHQSPDQDLVLIPLHTDSYVVAKHRERFDKLAKMALPDITQIDTVNNKGTLAGYCLEHGINTPPAIVPDSFDQFKAEVQDFTFPAFIKLPESCGAVGVIKVHSAQEAIETFGELIEEHKLDNKHLPILQQGVDGDDFCSTFLFDKGELKAAMTYHNLLDYPKKQGMGALRETVDAAEMEAMGAQLLSSLNWHGVAEIDFRWDGKSKPWLIEVNPRFWGGLSQSIASGIDYPYLIYKLAADGQLPEIEKEIKNARTFNPCLTFLLELEEFLEAKDTTAELADAFKEFKHEIKKGHVTTITNLFKNVASAINPTERLKIVKKIMHEDKSAINELLDWRDPLPLLGVLYPLAVFVKHGKITPDLLVK